METPYNKDQIDWDNINQYQSITTLPQEVWKLSNVINTQWENFSDTYQVSNYGRVRRLRGETTFVFKISDNGNGYKKLTVNYKKQYKSFYIHRLVAEAFLPNPNNLPQVNHEQTGLGKHDNRAEHLSWCTERENIIDAHKHGQMDYRKKVKTSTDVKSDEFVDRMYRAYKDSGKVGETARAFGVPRTSLSSIVNKRSRVALTDAIDREYESTP